MRQKKVPNRNRVPILSARNIGPQCAAEIEAMGIRYLDEIEKLGWEEFCIRYVEHFPHRLNLNAFAAVIGALEDRDWREIDSNLKLAARQLIRRIKSGRY